MRTLRNLVGFPVLDSEESDTHTEGLNKYGSTLLLSVAFANWPMCIPCLGQTSELTPKHLSAERIQVLAAEDPGVLPEDQVDRFAVAIQAQQVLTGVGVASFSRVTSQTNALVCERRQTLALEATKPQLLSFLRNLAESNSVLRVRDLSFHLNPDRTRLKVSVVVVGHYRLQPSGEPQTPELLETEYQVLNGRRHLRYAALDCYTLATEDLPASWMLEALNFEGGKRLSLQGLAPADQVRSLEDVRTRLQAAKDRGGQDLFRPSTSEATMQMVQPAMTSFSWSIQLELRPRASR
jgi:hypothetical protein